MVTVGVTEVDVAATDVEVIMMEVVVPMATDVVVAAAMDVVVSMSIEVDVGVITIDELLVLVMLSDRVTNT